MTPEFINVPKNKTKRLVLIRKVKFGKRWIAFYYKIWRIIREKSHIGIALGPQCQNHELTLLRIKYIRIKEKYGEGEVPYGAKSGSGQFF